MNTPLSHLAALEATVGRLARETARLRAARTRTAARLRDVRRAYRALWAVVDPVTEGAEAAVRERDEMRAELVYQRDNLRTLSVALWGEGAYHLSAFGVDRLVERIEAALAPPADAP